MIGFAWVVETPQIAQLAGLYLMTMMTLSERRVPIVLKLNEKFIFVKICLLAMCKNSNNIKKKC